MDARIARTPRQLGAVIRRERRKAGLTQTELGERVNMRQATISALESGESGTRLSTLLDVLAVLDLEMAIRERSKSTDRLEDLF